MKMISFSRVLLIAGCMFFINNALAQKKDPCPADSCSKYTAANCIVELDKSKAATTKAGNAFWFFEKAFIDGGVNLKMSTVDKGIASHAPHQHPHGECIYLLEGNAVAVFGEERIPVKPNTAMYFPGGVMHCVERAGEEPITYLVIIVN